MIGDESFGFERTIRKQDSRGWSLPVWIVWLVAFFLLGSMMAHCYYRNIG